MTVVRRVCRINGFGDVVWQDDGPGSFTCSGGSGTFTVTFPEVFINADSYVVFISLFSLYLSSPGSQRFARVYGRTTNACNIQTITFDGQTSTQGFTLELVGETA